MVTFPGLEVYSTKNSFLLSPESPDAFKQITAVGEGRICAFQSFIILFDILSLTDQKNLNSENYSNLEGISERRSVYVRDRGDILQVLFEQKTVGVGKRDGLLRQLHGMKPISNVIHLFRRK